MQRQEVKIEVAEQAGVIVAIKKAYMRQPAIRFRAGGINWYDDTKLLKAKKTGKNAPTSG